MVNWWTILAHLRKITGAQVKPSTVQRYVEELLRAGAELDRALVAAYGRRVAARKVQRLPHAPKLEPETIPRLIVKAQPENDDAEVTPTVASPKRQPRVAGN